MKRILALAMVLILALTLMAACTSKNDNPSGGGNDGTTAKSNNNDPDETEPNGGNGDTPAANNGDLEAIKALMEKAGYSGPIVAATEDTAAAWQGATACLNIFGDKGLIQFYSYPSASAAKTAKTNIWDPSAAGIQLGEGDDKYVADIDGNIVIFGNEAFVEAYKSLR